jgi:hypothetical protein
MMNARPDRATTARLQVSVCRALAEVEAPAWNALVRDGDPFLRHEFLVALERHDAVGRTFGWLPCHLLARDTAGHLAGAVPLYEKDNSYGEFVFDWAWADALERAGRRYYPKLVAAVPYTPVTEQRLLVHPRADYPATARALTDAALELARERGLPSCTGFSPASATPRASPARACCCARACSTTGTTAATGISTISSPPCARRNARISAVNAAAYRNRASTWRYCTAPRSTTASGGSGTVSTAAHSNARAACRP